MAGERRDTQVKLAQCLPLLLRPASAPHCVCYQRQTASYHLLFFTLCLPSRGLVTRHRDRPNVPFARQNSATSPAAKDDQSRSRWLDLVQPCYFLSYSAMYHRNIAFDAAPVWLWASILSQSRVWGGFVEIVIVNFASLLCVGNEVGAVVCRAHSFIPQRDIRRTVRPPRLFPFQTRQRRGLCACINSISGSWTLEQSHSQCFVAADLVDCAWSSLDVDWTVPPKPMAFQ
ncbi:hypothetical protein B0H67DRAFT_163682 [Lasiosphaeris hirsuta]|uniref:Uncharacterized protein n=1 Tax=Lasiosphaeris hirsuta TaxID=260670 RepID=A0AA40DY07_9PEZI|nr:hypothetical protein B0H67DRAFT_163682 [Lasiosphaeris hirsuta]